MHHHITGQLANLLGLVMYYSKHEQLKKKLRDQVCDGFERVKSRMWRSRPAVTCGIVNFNPELSIVSFTLTYKIVALMYFFNSCE